MSAEQEKGLPWVETKNYQNFIKNCQKYGSSKSRWIQRGCPATKPNGEAVKAAASA